MMMIIIPVKEYHSVDKLVKSKALCGGSSEIYLWFNTLDKCGVWTIWTKITLHRHICISQGFYKIHLMRIMQFSQKKNTFKKLYGTICSV